MSVDYLDKNNTDGTCLGQSATAKVSLYGATPVVQASSGASLLALTAMTGISAATVAGFSTLSQFQETISTILEMRDALLDLGILSAS